MIAATKADLRHVAYHVMQVNGGRLLVAGYGSLPNKPEPGLHFVGTGFIQNMEKSMCVTVRQCRGTPEFPGLVAGIQRRVGCRAMTAIMAVGSNDMPHVLDALWRRELDGLPYLPRVLTVVQYDGRSVAALGFVADGRNVDVGRHRTPHAAAVIRQAAGSCGRNREYLSMLLDFERRVFGRATRSIAAIETTLEQQDWMASF